MGHVILRVEKIHGGLSSLASVRNHHLPGRRHFLENREHPEREEMNQFWEYENKSLYEHGKELMKKYQEITGRKARKDAVCFIEVLTTVSPELEEEVMKRPRTWFNKNKEWIQETFSTCQVCEISIEYDESSAHIHWILAATDEKGKLNAREICGNRKDYEERQQSYEDKMREIFPFIDERTKNSSRPKGQKRKHKSCRQFWKEEDERLQQEHELKKARLEAEIQNSKDRLQKQLHKEIESVFDDKPVRQRSNERMSEGDFLDL